MLVLRFANPLFEPIWNRHHIDHATITLAETLGVEHRGSHYGGPVPCGDMVQNHLMQLLWLIAMEPPTSFDADRLRDRKMDVMRTCDRHASRLAGASPAMALGRREHVGEQGRARCRRPPKPDFLPVPPGRREGRWAMIEATSLPGEGPSIPGRYNCDTLSPKRGGDVIRDGTGACR